MSLLILIADESRAGKTIVLRCGWGWARRGAVVIKSRLKFHFDGSVCVAYTRDCVRLLLLILFIHNIHSPSRAETLLRHWVVYTRGGVKLLPERPFSPFSLLLRLLLLLLLQRNAGNRTSRRLRRVFNFLETEKPFVDS